METKQQEEKEGKIGAAIVAIMAELGGIGKTSENKEQKYMFRSVDAVVNAVNPLLTKHQVFVRPYKVLHEDVSQTAKGAQRVRQRIVFRFEHVDGSYRDSEVTGEGCDYGDKATNKCESGAFKYAICQTFCIRTDDPRDEQDFESPEFGPPGEQKGKAAQQKPAEKPKSEAKAPPAEDKQKAAMDKLVALLKTKGVAGKEDLFVWLNLKAKRDSSNEIKKLSDVTREEYGALVQEAEKLPTRGGK